MLGRLLNFKQNLTGDPDPNYPMCTKRPPQRFLCSNLKTENTILRDELERQKHENVSLGDELENQMLYSAWLESLRRKERSVLVGMMAQAPGCRFC